MNMNTTERNSLTLNDSNVYYFLECDRSQVSFVVGLTYVDETHDIVMYYFVDKQKFIEYNYSLWDNLKVIYPIDAIRNVFGNVELRKLKQAYDKFISDWDDNF